MATESMRGTDFWGHEESQLPLGYFLGQFCSWALQSVKVPVNKASPENHSTNKDMIHWKSNIGIWASDLWFLVWFLISWCELQGQSEGGVKQCLLALKEGVVQVIVTTADSEHDWIRAGSRNLFWSIWCQIEKASLSVECHMKWGIADYLLCVTLISSSGDNAPPISRTWRTSEKTIYNSSTF